MMRAQIQENTLEHETLYRDTTTMLAISQLQQNNMYTLKLSETKSYFLILPYFLHSEP